MRKLQASRVRHPTAVINARLRGARTSGFTLMELMVVVAIVGVLATLATYGVRKYVLTAKKAEAVAMLTQIRGAEEAYRDEMFIYRGTSTFATWHPAETPGTRKLNWNSTTSNATTLAFNDLGVRPDGAVNYAYSVVAGTVGATLPAIPTVRNFAFPAATGPFYIAMGRADLNGDGTFTYALSHSDTSEVYLDETF